MKQIAQTLILFITVNTFIYASIHIKTVAQFNQITDDPDAHYVIDRDLDFNNTGFNGLPITFNGTLDGHDHTLKNIYIDTSHGVDSGIFSKLSQSAQIKHLNIKNINILGAISTGAITGENSGIIEDISIINANIDGHESTGGVSGINTGNINHVVLSGKVSGAEFTGGITGYNDGIIKHTQNNALIQGQSETGGIAGYNTSVITQSLNTGPIDGRIYIGGITGFGNGASQLNVVSNTGAIRTFNDQYDGFAGGIAGLTQGSIENASNHGEVKSNSFVGGIAGHQESGIIKNTYNVGKVQGISLENTGAIVGTGYKNDVISSYFLKGCCMYNNHIGSPKSKSQLQQKKTYLDWDFKQIWRFTKDHYPLLNL